MKKDILFIGMDINKELKKVIEQLKSKIEAENKLIAGSKDLDMYYRGIEFATQLLESLMDNMIESNNDEDFVNLIVHIDNLKQPEEFLRSDLLKFINRS